tara:strand:- start:929 stop:1915 length:987 start_codon:yes stop_codon:yes gene_type:complete
MSWYEHIKNEIGFEKVLDECGHTRKNKRFKDCPACGASRTKKDKRPPVGIFGSKGNFRWHCNACQTSGNIADVISYHMFGCSAEQLDDFKRIKEYLNITRSSYTPTKVEPILEPEYPPTDEVLAVLRKGTMHLRDVNVPKKLEAFLNARGLDQTKIPCGLANSTSGVWDDLKKVKGNNNKESYWWPRQWTRQYGLIFPLVDHQGNIKSLLGRTWYSSLRKTTVPIGYTTKGLLLANHQARQWMKDREPVEEVIICEGEMDYATACQEHDGVIIGIRSGSVDVCRQLPWFAQTTVYIATDNDVTGNIYAKKIAKLVGEATPMRVRFGNE